MTRRPRLLPTAPNHPRRRSGLTLPELLVVVAIIGIAAGVLVPAIGRVRDASRQVTCLSNLQRLGTAFRNYAFDNERFPNPAFSQIPWERSLMPYVSPNTFQCPADAELGPATGSSYDWRDTGEPVTTLAGKTAREGERAEAVFVFDALPGWHQRDQMNVVRVNGTSQAMKYEVASHDLTLPIKVSVDIGLPLPLPIPGQPGRLAIRAGDPP